MVGDLVAENRLGLGDMPLVVEDGERPGAILLISRAVREQVLGRPVPLLDLGDRAGAVDVLEPEVGIVRRLGESGGRNEGRGGGEGKLAQGYLRRFDFL